MKDVTDLDETIAQRLRARGLEIPLTPTPAYRYLLGKATGSTAYASGQVPAVEGELVYVGRLGAEVDVEDGYKAAEIAALNCLSELEAVVGLERVAGIVKVNGYVASAEGFARQGEVVNGASDLLETALGEAGRHARTAVGVAWLPGHAPVEIELIAQLR